MLVGQSAIQEEVSLNQAECINDINTLQPAFMVYKFLLYLLYLFLGFYNKRNVKIIIGKIRSSEYTPERAVGYVRAQDQASGIVTLLPSTVTKALASSWRNRSLVEELIPGPGGR